MQGWLNIYNSFYNSFGLLQYLQLFSGVLKKFLNESGLNSLVYSLILYITTNITKIRYTNYTNNTNIKTRISRGGNVGFIKNFSPSWFASVMGTGIFAIAFMLYSKQFSYLGAFGRGLYYFNIALFIVLIIPWLLRLVLYPKEFLKDLKHPINSNFFATMPFGMLILAANFILIGKNMFWGGLFWFIGSGLIIIFALITMCIMFRHEEVKAEHLNPAWFIPPVGLIVIPIAGSLLVSSFSGILKEYIIVINLIGFGTGFFIYLALLAVMMYRFILHKPLAEMLAPTVWINLGPIGAGTVSIIQIAKNIGYFTNVQAAIFSLASLLWAFGIWWLIISISMTLHYLRKLKLPFALSWWAFTFPLGAYVVASFNIANILSNSLIYYIGFALLWLLAFLWSITLVNSIRNTINKKLFS